MPRGSDERRKLLQQVVRRLERAYGKRPWVPRGPGLDVLVEALLAQNTNMANASRGYKMLRRRFPTWTKVMAAPVADAQREIAICGLARMRAKRLQEMLRSIKADRGKLSIDFLADVPVEDAFAYLTAFHGIGPKSAAVVLLFAFGRPIVPVDNGVLRVVRRLKLVRQTARDLEAERVLSPLPAMGRHYATHVLLFRHAKEICKPKNPDCQACPLLELCPFGKRRVKHRPPEVEDQTARPTWRKPARLSRFASEGVRKREEGE